MAARSKAIQPISSHRAETQDSQPQLTWSIIHIQSTRRTWALRSESKKPGRSGPGSLMEVIVLTSFEVDSAINYSAINYVVEVVQRFQCRWLRRS
jgi:hypothetical protein